MKRALITGICGQDGSFLADLLLEKGYDVHGLHRHSSNPRQFWRIEHCLDRLKLHRGDVTDRETLGNLPAADEIYHMADQDSVPWSFDSPLAQFDVTAKAVISLLELLKGSKSVKVFVPVSATIFGDAEPPQSESTPLNPLSPYAVAKAAAFHACRYYRQVHGLHVSCGIMFNHDSERRSEDYLLSKIARSAVRIRKGDQKVLELGNLDQVVDVGYAPEFMDAAWRTLQQDKPGDWVVATGAARTVRQVAVAALCAVSKMSATVEEVPFGRPGPRCTYVGDASRAVKYLGWRPEHDALATVRRIIECA